MRKQHALISTSLNYTREVGWLHSLQSHPSQLTTATAALKTMLLNVANIRLNRLFPFIALFQAACVIFFTMRLLSTVNPTIVKRRHKLDKFLDGLNSSNLPQLSAPVQWLSAFALPRELTKQEEQVWQYVIYHF